jgi:hypothetical protein
LAATVVAGVQAAPIAIYRQTNGNNSGGNLAVTEAGWEAYRTDLPGTGLENVTNNGAAIGLSTNASKNFVLAATDRITATSVSQSAYNGANGLMFMSRSGTNTNGAFTALTSSAEFTKINNAFKTDFSTASNLTLGNITTVTFDYGLGNNVAHDTVLRLLILAGGNYYVSSTSYTNIINGGGAFVTSAQTATVTFDGAQWRQLTGFDKTTNMGTISGSDTTLSAGTLITGLGIYGTYGTAPGTARFDNVTITAVPEPASLSLLGLGAAALLLRRKRA